MKFSINDFFSKCDQIDRQFPADLVTFTEEILNRKIHFLCSVKVQLCVVSLVHGTILHSILTDEQS